MGLKQLLAVPRNFVHPLVASAPEIDIAGADYVGATFARGCGVIFWGANFSFKNLVTKMAMRRVSVSVMGFSIPLHGISRTVFGVRYLNRLYRSSKTAISANG